MSRSPHSLLARAARLAPLLLLPGVAGPAATASRALEPAREYEACMALARDAPAHGLESARAWIATGGGDAARHCAAVALIGLGHYGEAARRLERLAAEMSPAEAHLRPSVLAQSGQAWLLAGNTARAHAVQSAALRLDPDNVEIWLDRSITLAGAGDYWAALDDLNRALDLAPGRPDILILRASAYRRLQAPDLARDDIARALRRDPDNPDGLLERGILRRLAGETAGARRDWLRVIDLAEGTPAAQAARARLERLDVTAQ